MLKHKHHIIPRHMGGTDEASNLIELTVEEHAEAHRLLFLEHQKWQDFMAWQALSGQIGKEELRRMVTKLTLTGVPKTEEHKKKLSESKKGKLPSIETRKKMSMSNPYKGKKLPWNLNNVTPEANKKRSVAMVGRSKSKIECPHCHKIGGFPQMKQWHFDNCKGKK